MITYKIQSGDTLTSIANRYNTSVDAIADLNGITNKNLIYTGDTLNIPDTSTSGTSLPVQGGELISGGGPLPVNAMKITSETPVTPVTFEPSAPPMTVTEDVSKAREDLDEWKERRPDAYKSSYSDDIEGLVDALLEMKFDYDVERDPLFTMSRDEHMKNARLAMEDTLGRAAALTGGYGNSYALGAAQQSYNNELSSLTELIPELYEAAYGRFSDEREALADNITLLSDLDSAEFEKYMDMFKEYLNEGKLYSDNFNTLTKEDFDRYLDYSKLMLSAQNK